MLLDLDMQKLWDDNLSLRTETIALAYAIGVLGAVREALLVGRPSAELRQVSETVDMAVGQAKARLQVVLGLFEEVNEAALQAVELLKIQPATTTNQ